VETRAHYVLIGSFMLGGIILALLFTLWLGSVEREFDEYDVVFDESVSGLQVGAAVQFNGIVVGEVSDLRLAPNDPSRVIARIRLDDGTPVKVNTRAQLDLVGVTGLALIQLVGGTADAPLIKDVSRRRVPIIEGEAAGIAAAIASAGDIFQNVSSILNQDNAATIGRILDDIEALTDVLADNEGEIQQIVENVAVTTAVVRRNAEKLDQTVDGINSIVASTGTLVEEDIAGTLREIESAAQSANVLVADIQDIVDENRPAIDAFAQQGLGSAVGVIARAGRLVSTAESVLLEIDRDPARFLLGEGRPTTAD